MMSQTIPRPTWRGAERGSGYKILLKEKPEGFDTWLIKCGEKTAEGGMTGKVGSTKERHEGGSKGPDTLIKRFQGGFPTHRVSDEHDDKVNGVVMTKPGAGKPHTLLDCTQDTKLSEHMSYNGHFPKP
jgi:hypothetical protein